MVSDYIHSEHLTYDDSSVEGLWLIPEDPRLEARTRIRQGTAADASPVPGEHRGEAISSEITKVEPGIAAGFVGKPAHHPAGHFLDPLEGLNLRQGAELGRLVVLDLGVNLLDRPSVWVLDQHGEKNVFSSGCLAEHDESAADLLEVDLKLSPQPVEDVPVHARVLLHQEPCCLDQERDETNGTPLAPSLLDSGYEVSDVVLEGSCDGAVKALRPGQMLVDKDPIRCEGDDLHESEV